MYLSLCMMADEPGWFTAGVACVSGVGSSKPTAQKCKSSQQRETERPPGRGPAGWECERIEYVLY